MKTWKVKTLNPENLPNLPEMPGLIVRLLALRGLTAPAQINDFLNPDYNKLYDPFLFKDMQKGVERIKLAIDRKEKITIYADYDADAITACAVTYLTLQKLGANVDHYIPDRFSEGYGINEEAIKKIAENGSKLIITVDCGINANAGALVCKNLGMDLIITDHHEVTGELPEALAIINPKNPSDNYPFPYLTGVGVAFKLVQGLASRFQTSDSKFSLPLGFEKWLLDLVAIGTVADIQSISDENRILVSFGLKVMAKTRMVGLKILLDKAGVKNPPDAFTLGFIVAPRINAAGRIAHANTAFELLVTADSEKAEKLSEELDNLNRHRQNLTEQIMSEAKSQLELVKDKKVLLAVGSDWPKGIVGLVAGKLAEEYRKPVLAISTSSDGLAVGSARSVAGFDIVEALKHAKDLLQKYGGHTQAAGFSLMAKDLEDFHLKLLDYADQVNLALAEPLIEADAEVTPMDITWENLEYLEKMAPWGYGNPKPKFMGSDFEVLDVRLVGAQSQHLKLKVRYGEHRLPAIAFNQGFLATQIKWGSHLDAIFELGSNTWNGNKEIELKFYDIKLKI
ncbi:MAG TPA: single-stranded-DNA-specific exonuclease RecJ [Methylomirabilota bacterium]|nr:single-stranded-DNA-specific exonuclease RecJ [Methylomirabilota bacterium]